MWIPFECNKTCYVGELDVKDSMVYMHVCNFKKIWIQESNVEDFMNDFKTQNPLIESNAEETITKLRELLGECKCNANINDDIMVLEITDEIDDGYKFNYKFSLIEGSEEVFFSKVTKSLLDVIHQLQVQRNFMQEKLEAKDKEIQQHIFDNGDIKRVDLKTEKFDIKKLSKDDNTSVLSIFTKSNYVNTLFTTLGIENGGKLKELVKARKPKKRLKRCKNNAYMKLVQRK